MQTKCTFTLQHDNIQKVKTIERDTLKNVLTEWGILAQGYATEICPKDTGNLAQSIDYKRLDENMEVQVGTNVEYAAYVELGTGLYAEMGDGRKTPWTYKDDEGKWHRTSGMRAQPYLRPAIEEHVHEYEEILKDNMSEQI